MSDREIFENYKDYWEEYSEFWLEEMSLEAAETNLPLVWIDEHEDIVRQRVKERTGVDLAYVIEQDWIREAMQEKRTIEAAVDLLVELVGELDEPETWRNTPTLSAWERSQ